MMEILCVPFTGLGCTVIVRMLFIGIHSVEFKPSNIFKHHLGILAFLYANFTSLSITEFGKQFIKLLPIYSFQNTRILISAKTKLLLDMFNGIYVGAYRVHGVNFIHCIIKIISNRIVSFKHCLPIFYRKTIF